MSFEKLTIKNTESGRIGFLDESLDSNSSLTEPLLDAKIKDVEFLIRRDVSGRCLSIMGLKPKY